MDKRALVGVDIDGGEELLRVLEDRGVEVAAALWLYFPEAEEWRLVIATPIVDEEGPSAAYKEIQEALREIPTVAIPLERTVAVGRLDRLVEAVHTVLREPATGKVHALRGVINGVEIPDSFVYDLRRLSATDVATINQQHTIASKAALKASEAPRLPSSVPGESRTRRC